MNLKCRTCGKEIDVCYADEGALGLTHGRCQCKECFIKDGHPLCPHCGVLTMEGWNFCANCGTALAKKV